MADCSIILRQYASRVTSYSSEYGLTVGSSPIYAAENLIGRPYLYPKGGDHPRIYTVGEYGYWFQRCPSARSPLPLRRPYKRPACAYIDVVFDVKVYPRALDLFECRGCGVLLRVWGYDDCSEKKRWLLLWEANESFTEEMAERNLLEGTGNNSRSYKHSASLRNVDVLIRMLRLELDHSNHEYYPCLDAVLFTGRQPVRRDDFYESIANAPDVEYQPDESDSDEYTSDEEEEPLRCVHRELYYMGIKLHDLLYLNVCNKVVTYGLQNYLRTYEDVERDGPDKIGNIPISDLIEMFETGKGDNYLSLNEDEHNDNVEQRTDDASSNTMSLTDLPIEIIAIIFELLDLRSLCCVAQTCKKLKEEAYNSRLYTFITLKDWWWTVSDQCLESLAARLPDFSCQEQPDDHADDSSNNSPDKNEDMRPANASDWGTLLTTSSDARGTSSQQMGASGGSRDDRLPSTSDPDEDRMITGIIALDLSWCGSYGTINSDVFMSFIKRFGRDLTVLRLACCEFIVNYTLYHFAIICRYLRELDLSRCYNIDQLGLREIKSLNFLSRLDLSYTDLSTASAHIIFIGTPRMEHLSINGCTALNMDQTCQSLSTFCPKLVSLQAWRTKNLTEEGLEKLSVLPHLADLDVGWAFTGHASLTDGITALVDGCKKLERLRFTAARYLNDLDLRQIAYNCKYLRQLDVMGNMNITPEYIHVVLGSCPKMEMIDVSCCPKITESWVQRLRRFHPRVSIIQACNPPDDY